MDFRDGTAIIRTDGVYLYLSAQDGTVLKTERVPNAGRKLSDLAFANGARRVIHDYDLRIDE